MMGLNLDAQLMLEESRHKVKYHSKSVVFCQGYL